jgi:hypothetical protein
VFVEQAYQEFTGDEAAAKAVASQLLFEGRSAVITISGSTSKVSLFGDLAGNLFDFVNRLSEQELLVSVVEGVCENAIDLAFVVDGSDSIIPEDYDLAKLFVRTVAQRFNFGPEGGGKQQMSMITFSGHFLSYTEANKPPLFKKSKKATDFGEAPTSVPENGQGGDATILGNGEYCPDHVTPSGKRLPTYYESNQNFPAAPARCFPAQNYECPAGTYYAKTTFSGDPAAVCACRVPCSSWESPYNVQNRCTQERGVTNGCTGDAGAGCTSSDGCFLSNDVNLPSSLFGENSEATGMPTRDARG